MLALLQFAVFTLAVFGSLGLLLMWIRRCHPRWRTAAAFVVAMAAAYAASFSLDLFVGSLVGIYKFKPYVMAVFLWMGYAVGLHFMARVVTGSPNPIRFAYLLTGGLATMVGILGPHKYNISVGLLLLVVALACLVLPQVACSGRQEADRSVVTDLMVAAYSGDTEAVKALLAKGAEVEATDDRGHTALMNAALGGHTRTVEVFLDAGAAVDARDNKGRTALIVAALNGHSDTVRVLLDNGADINAKDNDGTTASLSATLDGHSDTVRLLLSRDADVDAKGATGRTALIIAAWKGHTDIVQALLSNGADVNAETVDGATALEVAAFHGYSEIVRLLRKAGAKE